MKKSKNSPAVFRRQYPLLQIDLEEKSTTTNESSSSTDTTPINLNGSFNNGNHNQNYEKESLDFVGLGSEYFAHLNHNNNHINNQINMNNINDTNHSEEENFNSENKSSNPSLSSVNDDEGHTVESPLSSRFISNSQITKIEKILSLGLTLSNSSSSLNSSTSSNISIERSGPERIDLNALRKVSWNGLTEEYRAYSWKLLLGYLPASIQRQKETLTSKREEYSEMVSKYFYQGKMGRTSLEADDLRQIQKDVPRTHPSILFQSKKIRKSLERLLYIWSIRHPASGYVQGIDNIAVPFYLVFLSDTLEVPCHETLELDGNAISDEVLNSVECDTFWCFETFLNLSQDFYTHGNPGIYKILDRLELLVQKIEPQLHKHLLILQKEGIGLEYSQFGFRWINCLLVREFNILLIVRLYDTYISEGERLSEFITFLSASIMKQYSTDICKLDFLDTASFFRDSPTREWKEIENLEELLSEAYVLQSLYSNT